ncbi:MAG: hypothetical protein DRJ05_07180, partial [Bacteroidetes bacterium]
KELHTNVQIDKVHISIFGGVSINNILIEDLHQDTLMKASRFSVGLRQFSLKNKKLHFKEINIDSAVFRLRKYDGSEKMNLAFIMDYFKTNSNNETKGITDTTYQPQDKQWDIQLGKLILHNSEFVYNNQNNHGTEGQMDYYDMKVIGINLDLQDFFLDGDTLFAKINQLSAKEKCGLVLDSLSGDFKFSNKILQVKNFRILTPMNDLDLDLDFSYNSLSAYLNFIQEVKIKAHIRPSIANLTEVGYFAKVMFPMDNRIKISGDIKGAVDNIKAKNFKFAYGKTTQFRGDISMTGLPEVRETFAHLSIRNFITSAADVAFFKLPTEDVFIPVPKVVDNFGKVVIKGKFTGFYNDFVSYANFKTDVGKINTDLALKVNSSNTVTYKGRVETINLNAGKLFEVGDKIGMLTLSAHIDGEGFNKDNADITLNGLIDSIYIYDETYRKISLAGNFADKKFTGNLLVDDKKVKIDFNGAIDYNMSIPNYNFTAKIDSAYLQKINISQRHPSMCFSTNMNIDFQGNNIDNIQGIIKLNDTRYSEKGKKYNMEDFTLSITRDSTEYTFISLYSDIADAMVEGKFMLAEVPALTTKLFNMYLDTLFVETAPKNKEYSDQDFIFEVTLKNTNDISELFAPQLLVSPNTIFTGGFNTRINNLFMDGRSPGIIYNGTEIKNWDFDFYIHENEIRLTTGCERLVLSDTLGLDSLYLYCAARNDSLLYSINWDNKGITPSNIGNIAGFVDFDNKDRYKMKFDRADITIADSVWRVDPDNFLSVDTGFIQFNDFTFSNLNQSIGLDGIVSSNPYDSILISFDNFDLKNLKIALERMRVDMDGVINGNFELKDYYGSPNYLSDIAISDFYFNKEKLGDALLSTTWNTENKSLDILGQIIYTGNVGKRKTLDISGSYYPKSEAQNFDIDIALENYKLVTVEPFMTEFASNVGGMASGKLKLSGTKEKPKINGTVNLLHTSMKINYLNVTYYFAGQANLTNDLIYFNDLVVYDSLNNEALCSGQFSHNYLKDFQMDLRVKTDQIAGLNTKRADNDIFYGKAIAGADVHIFGPVNNLAFDISVESKKGTNIKIPVSFSVEVNDNDFIVFKQPEMDTALIESVVIEKPMDGLAMKLDLNLNNDADIQMFLPYNMGNIRGKGHGEIKMDISPEGSFTMNGDYLLDRGSFFLTLQNIINRDFEIRRGSKVSWTGDPYNAEINLKAVYKVKTTLGDYDPAGNSEQRVSVDCVIGLSNNLYNPEIEFGIEFPDMRESDKQFVYSRLDTTDQALMSQQMLSLLVLNSFANAGESSGGVSFNTYSLLTNQLNNWLSNISNDFDIGINYRPGDEISQQEVEVALSTQLFDDRVIIDGNVGMVSEDKATTTNEIVGEVTVEVMLTPDGRWRGKAFNKSNHDYLYKNYSPYTQGVGIFYTKEFSSFKDLFISNKKKEQKKEEDELSISE